MFFPMYIIHTMFPNAGPTNANAGNAGPTNANAGPTVGGGRSKKKASSSSPRKSSSWKATKSKHLCSDGVKRTVYTSGAKRAYKRIKNGKAVYTAI